MPESENTKLLKARNQQLTKLNQQLVASEQQLKAANQQLAANEQQLQAANQQLKAHENELIKARNIAQVNELRYRKAQEAGHIGSWEFDFKTNEFWGSDEAKRIYNLDLNKKAFSEAEVMKIVAEGDRDQVNQAMIDLLNENEPYDIIFEIIPQNTTEKKIIRSIAELEKDKDGKPQKVTGVLIDITKQKLAEQQLRESEEKHRALYQNAPIAYQSLNIDGKIIDTNPQWLKTLKYEKNEVTGKWFGDFLLHDSKKKFIKNFEKFKKKGVINGVEFEMLRSDGTEIIVSFEGCIGNDEKGNFKQTYCTFKDITQQKKIEQKIKESESFLKAIFENSLNAIVVTDDDGNYISVNKAASILLGYPIENLLKMNVSELQTVKNKSALKKFKEYFEKQEDSGEFEFITPGGIKKTALYSAVRIKKDFNLSILADITERKKVELELISAKEKAEEADMLKSAFLANMSHEIRTPMNGILGFTNLLKDPNLSDERHSKFIEIIQKSGNRMLDTVNDLIDISRIETGQVNVHTEKVDINREIESLYYFFSEEARQNNLDFELENKLPAATSEIITDKSKFNSIVSNLIKNAIKFTDSGYIKIGVEIKNDLLYCFVKDSGIGIPKSRQKAIFNRFEQADIKDTHAFQGSGLGLAIVKAYVQMLKGEVGVESEKGKGSIFWVKLPVKKGIPTRPKNPEKKERAQKAEPEQLKILIAEDDSFSSKHLAILLADKAKQLLYSGTGRETIEICKKHPDIDLILMDVQMPDINGYDATREIKKFSTKIKIIAQTAYALAGEREKALAAGCDEYISKPIDADLLFALMRKTLNKN